MMFSLTACQSFEAKMTKAAAKMEKLQSYRMDLDMDMEMNLALLGESMDMNMSMKGTQSGEPKVLTHYGRLVASMMCSVCVDTE
jgi:hypothetical protein